ncbi:MAG: 2-phospho-L-lactate guanylyltransferase [Cohaesibacteraceae bacterium]
MSTSNADLCVVIPMKDPEQAKTRLGDVLPAETRAALTRTLFRNTLRVLRTVDSGLHIVVVTASPSIALIAHPFRAQVLDDPGEGLSAAAEAGARYAAHHRFRSVCILPGDLADPLAKDFETLFAAPRPDGSVIIAPAHDGGTNALIASPPDALPFSYGQGSCAKHQASAEEAGLSCLVMPLPSLLYDVDRSSDLGSRLVRGLDRSLGAFGA